MQTLPYPPIVEALAQINYQLSHPVTDQEVEKFSNLFAGFEKEELKQVELDPAGKVSLNLFGYKLSRKDTKEFIQVTKGFFAYARNSKYKDWKDFSSHIGTAISRFVKTAQPAAVSRIALRYVNRITIPTKEELTLYLKVRPELEDLWGYEPEILTLNFTMPISSIDGRAIVNVRLDRRGDEGWQLLLDIDTFMTGKFRTDSVMNEFDRLRGAKNEIFKMSLTDAAIETFNK